MTNSLMDPQKNWLFSVQEQIRLHEKNRVRSAWYNPTTAPAKDTNTGRSLEPQTIYIGESNSGTPTWEEAVLHVPTYVEGMRYAAANNGAKTDKHLFSPWRGDWDDRQNEYLKVKQAGVITQDDFSAINVVNVMAELLGTVYLNHTLEQAVNRVNTPSLHLDIDTYTKFTAQQDVDEGITTPTRKGTFARQSLDLKKDVGHISLTDEVQMRPYQHDIYQTHIENAVADLKRVKARKIAGVIEAATGVAGSDWAALTGEHSTANPYDQLGTVIDTIVANGGNVDTIASADRPNRDFFANTWVKGTTTPNPATEFGARVITNVNGLAGITWYVDPELTNTQVTIYDKKAVVLAQGPVRTANYRSEVEGLDGYITRDYNAAKVVQSGFIRVVTGISA
jgi:hypothetical protein